MKNWILNRIIALLRLKSCKVDVLTEFIVMPNHIHGVIFIVGAPPVGARKSLGDSSSRADAIQRAGTRPAPTVVLGDVVGAFKSLSTNRYIRNVKQHGWAPFSGKLWQRNYYEHVVRNEKELNRIREYIRNNPTQWDTDEDNPFTHTQR